MSTRDSCTYKHFWHRRRSPCACRGSFWTLANPSALHDPAWYDAGHIHGGEAEQIDRFGLVKVGLTCAKQHTDADAWAHVSKNAQELTRQWLKLRAKVEFLDVRPPTRIAGATDALQVIVFVPASAWIPILRASVMDGIFVRQFILFFVIRSWTAQNSG